MIFTPLRRLWTPRRRPLWVPGGVAPPRRRRRSVVPFWRGGRRAWAMAEEPAGDVMLDDDGNVILNDDGDVSFDCGGTFRQYKKCSDDTLVDLWEADDPTGLSYPKYIYYLPDDDCYWIDGTTPTSSSPGRTLGADDHAVKTACSPCKGSTCGHCADYTPPVVGVQIAGLTGVGCCDTSVEGFPGSVFFEVAMKPATCLQSDEHCVWDGIVENVGTYTSYDDGACSVHPDPIQIDASVVADLLTGHWSVSVLLYLHGTAAGSSESGYGFLGQGGAVTDCRKSEGGIGNTVAGNCLTDIGDGSGFFRPMWANGGTATVSPH